MEEMTGGILNCAISPSISPFRSLPAPLRLPHSSQLLARIKLIVNLYLEDFTLSAEEASGAIATPTHIDFGSDADWTRRTTFDEGCGFTIYDASLDGIEGDPHMYMRRDRRPSALLQVGSALGLNAGGKTHRSKQNSEAKSDGEDDQGRSLPKPGNSGNKDVAW